MPAKVSLALSGYPLQTEILVGLTEEPGGQKLDGDVALFVRHTTGAEGPYSGNDGPIVAKVTNGSGKVWAGDMTEFKTLGWDTFIAEFQGIRESLQLPGITSQNPSLTAPTPSPASTPTITNPNPVADSKPSAKGLSLRFVTVGPPQALKQGEKVRAYAQRTRASVFQDGRTLEGALLDFYQENTKEPRCLTEQVATDADGDYAYTFELKPGGTGNTGSISLRARIRGTDKEAQLTVAVPKPRQEGGSGTPPSTGSARLYVDVDSGTQQKDGQGEKVVYVVTLRAVNKFDRFVDAGRISWRCGTLVGTAECNGGYHNHTVEVREPGEHNYIAHSTKLNTSSIPKRLRGPAVKNRRATKLAVNLLRTTYTADAAKHVLVLEACDSQGDRTNAGKVFWSLGDGQDGGEVDLSTGVATLEVEIPATETELPFTAVSPQAGISLPRPFDLRGRKAAPTPAPAPQTTSVTPTAATTTAAATGQLLAAPSAPPGEATFLTVTRNCLGNGLWQLQGLVRAGTKLISNLPVDFFTTGHGHASESTNALGSFSHDLQAGADPLSIQVQVTPELGVEVPVPADPSAHPITTVDRSQRAFGFLTLFLLVTLGFGIWGLFAGPNVGQTTQSQLTTTQTQTEERSSGLSAEERQILGLPPEKPVSSPAQQQNETTKSKDLTSIGKRLTSVAWIVVLALSAVFALNWILSPLKKRRIVWYLLMLLSVPTMVYGFDQISWLGTACIVGIIGWVILLLVSIEHEVVSFIHGHDDKGETHSYTVQLVEKDSVISAVKFIDGKPQESVASKFAKKLTLGGWLGRIIAGEVAGEAVWDVLTHLAPKLLRFLKP